MTSDRFRFLYRQSEGRIGPGDWARASLLPVGIALAMTAVAAAIAPGPRDLSTQPFFSLSIVAVHIYFIIYGFALIVAAVAQYCVSAKRFNDLGQSSSWAGLAPFALLLLGAALWYQPRSEGVMPAWAVYPFVALAVGAIIWNVLLLGFVRAKP